MIRRAGPWIASLASLALACGGGGGGGPGSGDAGTAASSSAAVVGDEAARLDALLAAEHRRSAGQVLPADQQSRDVRVRRAAARALARIGGDASRAPLLKALADEDDAVTAWAAYGLGFACKGHEGEHVSALVAAAVAERPAPTPAKDGAPPAVAPDAMSAIARAVGRCAGEQSEATLVAWLGGARERAIASARGLGDLGIARKKLREETLVALLNVAAGSASSPPVAEALFPIGRLENVPLTVVERVREVAAARLADPGPARLLAVRALGRAGLPAATDLGRVLSGAETFSPAERAEAARNLKRLGKPGQRALGDALPALVPPSDPIALTALVGEPLGVLLAVLDALEPERIAPAATKALRDLATLEPPPSAPAAIVRRVSWIRCGAAKLLSNANYRDPLLLSCDRTAPVDAAAADAGAPPPAPTTGSIGLRALVAVLGRADLTGPRLAAWREIASGSDVRAREAALELLEAHPETAGSADVLAEALAAKEDGVVSTAADVIGKQPQRASRSPARPKKKRRNKKDDDREAPSVVEPSPAVVQALEARLSSMGPTSDPEVLASLLGAAAALGLKDQTGRIEELCRSSWPSQREQAKKALETLTAKKNVACDPPAGGGDAPAELGSLVRAPVTVTFETDVGELGMSLETAIAPVTVTRVVELVKRGYYDGMVVHRVVPGFVTQFGAPLHDGYGGPPDRPPLRCETSQLPFAPLAIGMALSGRDTGSSQLFVMHAHHPHLDGNYAWLGTATGPWGAFVDGDVIRKARVKD